MSELNKPLLNTFIEDVRNIIVTTRTEAIRSVEFYRVQMYWKVGERIFVEEQGKKERADYGAYLVESLAQELEQEFGSGFSKRQLELCRQFYRIYPIANALRSQLNWSQYRMLIRIANDNKREYYALESVKNHWNGRELERQIHAQLYERLLLSNDKESVLAVARNERQPQLASDIIKDPMYLEFLGLEAKAAYYERDLESALITHLQSFLLELGNGFTFVARQKRLLIEDDEFFVDLVLYNRLLRCFVVMELKTEKLQHHDLGQLQMYVNYYDRREKLPEENPTIGILLCPLRNKGLVEMTLPVDSKLIAAQYELVLPNKHELEEKLNQWMVEYEQVERELASELGEGNE